jgi:hypothetical protein
MRESVRIFLSFSIRADYEGRPPQRANVGGRLLRAPTNVMTLVDTPVPSDWLKRSTSQKATPEITREKR